VGGKVPVIVLHNTAADGPWDVQIVRRLEPDASASMFLDVAEDDPDLQHLLAILNGHPLSIRLAALQVAKGIVSVGELAAQIPQEDDAPYERAMAVIAACFNLLDATDQGLLLVMAASFTDGLSADLLGRVLGTSAPQLTQTLIERGFVTGRGDLPYYELHTLVQRHAVNHLRENGRFFETRQRLLEAVVAFTDVHTNGDNDHLLRAEIDNILNAALYAKDRGDFHALGRLVDSLSSVDDLLHSWGYQSELERLKQIVATTQRPTDEQPVIEVDTPPVEPDEIIDAPADETLPGKPNELGELGELETVAAPAQTFALSIYSDLEAAFNEAAARRDRSEMARISMQMGSRHLENDEVGLALDRFEQAMALYQEIGDLANLLDALEMLALNSVHLRGADDAFAHVRRGLNIANQLGDDGRRCRFMSIMGDLHASLGDASNAMEAYKRAIKLSRLLEDDEQTGVTLGKLAALYMDYGRFREATVALSQAIALFEGVRRADL
jgi:tetratricopeptide (TPR) repeat protein